MNIYKGQRHGNIPIVTVNNVPLNSRLDLMNHSSVEFEFEWGYGGSRPAQLALALLANHLNDDKVAIAFHQSFKWKVVSKLPYEGWELTSQQIDAALKIMRSEV
jgi:hypothetical protein